MDTWLCDTWKYQIEHFTWKSTIKVSWLNSSMTSSEILMKGVRMGGVSHYMKEFASMLYWTMLAACTVGPGTVVTCSRAGAEFELNLIWALVVAGLIAFTLQVKTNWMTETRVIILDVSYLYFRYRHEKDQSVKKVSYIAASVLCLLYSLIVYNNNIWQKNCQDNTNDSWHCCRRGQPDWPLYLADHWDNVSSTSTSTPRCCTTLPSSAGWWPLPSSWVTCCLNVTTLLVVWTLSWPCLELGRMDFNIPDQMACMTIMNIWWLYGEIGF